MGVATRFIVVSVILAIGVAGQAQENNQPPSGFRALFNGKDLTNWSGQRTLDPRKWKEMTDDQRRKMREEDDEDMRRHWRVEDGEIINDGHGVFLSTDEAFQDFELWIDYKTVAQADSGIYLRGVSSGANLGLHRRGRQVGLGGGQGLGRTVEQPRWLGRQGSSRSRRQTIWTMESVPHTPDRCADQCVAQWSTRS